MITFKPGRPHGFTLIELLVVIAILGILAGILIPTVAAVRTSANKTKTKVQFTQWIAAMEQFRQEYGYYPQIVTSQKLDPAKFAPALMGKLNLKGDPLPANAAALALAGNTKRISFYTPSAGDLSTDSLLLNDAFGNSDFVVRYDANGDSRITATDIDNLGLAGTWVTVTSANSGATLNPTVAEPTLTTDGVRASVAIYSAGKGETNSDIVLSWK